MKVTIELNDIDYGALAEILLPLVKDKLSQSEGNGAGIITTIASVPPSIAGKMIDVLPQKTKDELCVMLLNKNKEKIVESIMEYAEKNGVSFKIDNIEVE